MITSIIHGYWKINTLEIKNQFSQPALSTIARNKKIAKQVQVALFKVDSALLALENIELPLAASPPIPSPFGLCNSTKRIKIKPEAIHIQERTELIIISIIFKLAEEFSMRLQEPQQVL